MPRIAAVRPVVHRFVTHVTSDAARRPRASTSRIDLAHRPHASRNHRSSVRGYAPTLSHRGGSVPGASRGRGRSRPVGHRRLRARSPSDPPRARGGGMRRLAIGGLLLVCCLFPNWQRADAATSTSIGFWGDSLTFQAQGYLAHDFTKATMVGLHDYPGTALCDWLSSIEQLTSATAPQVAVLEFIGNDRPCDGSPATSTSLAASYKADLKKAIAALEAAGVQRIVLDEGPRAHCTFYAYCAAQPQLHAVFESLVGSKVSYAGTADRSAATPDGRFTMTLPCLSSESRAGKCSAGASVQVRAHDGVHFCPRPD